MPLQRCIDCSHQVSDAAVSCPGCGRPPAPPRAAPPPRRSANALDGLRSRPVQVAAVAVALFLTAINTSTHLPDAVRLGSAIAQVIIAALLASLVLAWRRPARGFIPVLTLVLVVPVMMLDRSAPPEPVSGSGTASLLPRDVHRCYQDAIADGLFITPEPLSTRQYQQRAIGYVNECLLLQGYSDNERSGAVGPVSF